jgi:hypothetical protein
MRCLIFELLQKGGICRRITKQFERNKQRLCQIQSCAVRLVTKHTALEPRKCSRVSSVPLRSACCMLTTVSHYDVSKQNCLSLSCKICNERAYQKCSYSHIHIHIHVSFTTHSSTRRFSISKA